MPASVRGAERLPEADDVGVAEGPDRRGRRQSAAGDESQSIVESFPVFASWWNAKVVPNKSRWYTAGMHPGALHLIDTFGLVPHPEGGFYRETFRSTTILSGLPSGPRAAATAIYFLLPAGTCCVWHRVSSDELWCHYDGDPLELHTLTATGAHDVARLGRNYMAEQRPQHAVPAGVLQAATPVGDRWTLAGCIVAPGFDFADFSMPSRQELCEQFPSHRPLIERFTRS